MKKFVIPLVVALLAACSNPVLKWIDAPSGGNGDNGRMAGQPDAKEIVSFSFGVAGETDLPIGKERDISGKIPIAIILPMGTGLGALTPTVAFIGKSLDPPSGQTRDFSSPVVYTVTAEDNSTVEYNVKVYEKGPSTKEIVRFSLDISQAGGSAASAEGVINEVEAAVIVTVPAGTDLKALTAHVTHTGAEALDPLNGSHLEETFSFSGDFSAQSAWTVVARDYTAKTYTVRVIREKSGVKEITEFSLGVSGEADVIGGEPQPDGKYPILAVVSENAVLNALTPFIKFRGASLRLLPKITTTHNF
jgi:hypothetical protein